MSEAAWNLCPVSGTPQGSDCYYTNDQTFAATTGTSTTVITDCPDGEGSISLLHSQLALCCLPEREVVLATSCPILRPKQVKRGQWC